MTKKDRLMLLEIIDNDGFDYAFRCYSDFKKIKDNKFHELREAYLDAFKDLENYIALGE